MKTKTAPHNAGSRDFFVLRGSYLQEQALQNEMMVPNARRRRFFFWDLGAFYTKNTSSSEGSAPAAGGKFWAFGGRCTQKSRCWDAFRNVFLTQNTPKILKIFRLRRAKSPNVRENLPPCSKSGNNKGGSLRYRLMRT